MNGKKGFIKAIKDEKGFNLMEVALAMALLGIVAVAYLGALATGARAIMVADERATAESLARTQMEYVRQQPYIDYSVDPHDVYYMIGTPAAYSLDLSAVPIDPDTGDPYDQSGGVYDQDDGIQEMTVTIQRTVDDRTMTFTLVGYKADR